MVTVVEAPLSPGAGVVFVVADVASVVLSDDTSVVAGTSAASGGVTGAGSVSAARGASVGPVITGAGATSLVSHASAVTVVADAGGASVVTGGAAWVAEVPLAAFEVYNTLGPGFLEAVYHEAMAIELTERDIPFLQHNVLTIFYKGRALEKGYIPDFTCYDRIIVELKAISSLSSTDEAQVLNYMKAARLTSSTSERQRTCSGGGWFSATLRPGAPTRARRLMLSFA